MALLLSFFVMLVAFSTQDQQKLKIVAGSMREAFGVQTESRFSGIVETDGLPTRTQLKHIQQNPDDAKNPVNSRLVERGKLDGARLKVDREFALASASLRQALQDMPELTEMSKHIMFEETKEGLNLEIVDQDGRSMFPDGSKEPYERTRLLIQKLAAPLARNAAPGRRDRPHRRERRAATLRLQCLRPVRRPRQRRPANPEKEGLPTCTSSWWPARRIRSRCFRTIQASPPTAA